MKGVLGEDDGDFVGSGYVLNVRQFEIIKNKNIYSVNCRLGLLNWKAHRVTITKPLNMFTNCCLLYSHFFVFR